MGDGDAEHLLATFGEYLFRSRIADENCARFYVGWVRQFLRGTPVVATATADEALTAFLDSLERAGRADWQVEQARKAVTAWLGWREQERKAMPAPKVARAPDGSVIAEDALAALRDTIRVRHYSYR